MLLLCGILPLITKPTRVSDSSATIIDHILTNDLEHSSILGIVEKTEISDHYPILCQVKLTQTRKKRIALSLFTEINQNLTPIHLMTSSILF